MEDEWTALVLIFWCIMPPAQSKSYGGKEAESMTLSLHKSELISGMWFLVLGGKSKSWQRGGGVWFMHPAHPLEGLSPIWGDHFWQWQKNGSACRSVPCGCSEGLLWVTTFVVWAPVPAGAAWADELTLSSGERTDGGAFQLVLVWARQEQ